MENLTEQRYQRAKEKVANIRGFYGNLMAYIIVIPFLAYLNYRTTDFLWVIFPAFGWGLGLVVNGLHAFGINPLFGKDWEERKIKEYMNDGSF